MEKDNLNKYYSDLYNSLGVEPGLLSKTTIGTKLNKKFRDDSIDALLYSMRYLSKNNNDKNTNKPVIEDSSPFHNLVDIKLK